MECHSLQTNQSCMQTLSHYFWGDRTWLESIYKQQTRCSYWINYRYPKTKASGYGALERERMCVCLCTNEPTPGLIETSEESVLRIWGVDYSNKFAKIPIIIHTAATTAQSCQIGTPYSIVSEFRLLASAANTINSLSVSPQNTLTIEDLSQFLLTIPNPF